MLPHSQDTRVDDDMLQAIHECVYGSTVRHVLDFPRDTIIHYLSTFPFYRGADTLYYLLLRRFGEAAYYNKDGDHLVMVQPELMGAYVLAEQNVHALAKKNIPHETIFNKISEYISRTLICERYQLRNTILTEEAEFKNACQIPSIALNFPKYQREFANLIEDSTARLSLIMFDCWEAFDQLDPTLMQLIIDRIGFVRGAMVNAWNKILKQYYEQQLIRLKIHEFLPQAVTRQITILDSIYPNLIRMPKNLDTLGVRLWFSSKLKRAYLLGVSVDEGLPSDEFISERLRHLKEVGIERYANEITGIRLNDNGTMTGQIGMIQYPQIQGKRLVNIKDLNGFSLDMYYPHDLFPLTYGENVVMISRRDIIYLINNDRIAGRGLSGLLSKDIFPYIPEPPTKEVLDNFHKWMNASGIRGIRGIPARIKLVEIMTWDIIDYTG